MEIACIVRYRERWSDALVLCRCVPPREGGLRASTNHKSKLELEKGGQGGISLGEEKRVDAR